MAEITINGVKYTNVPNKKAGTKFAASLTQSNIGASQAVQDYVNSAYFYPLVNAIDINWNGVEVEENSYINTTSDLISYIASKESNIDLSSYATMTYVDQKITDLIGGAPETLDTLKELADALGEEASLAYVTQALDGKADKSSLTNYATNSYVTTELDKKANKSEIVQADMCETDNTSKSYVLNNPYQYHLYSQFGTNYYCYNLIFPHNTSFDNTDILNSRIKNCVIIGNNHNIYNNLQDGLIQGYKNKIQNDHEVAFGQYNSSTRSSDNSTKTVFSIGNGTLATRHNALEVKSNGQIYIADTKNGTPYILQTKLNSKADLSYVTSELANKANLSDIPAAPDLTPYASYEQANSYYAYKSDIPDMTNYVDINSYNALVARVEELAGWIVSYHSTPEPPTPSYDFNFDDEYINMNIGDTVTPSITNTSEYTIISYTSSDSSVVSVDANGACTALTLGQATISATLYDNDNNEQAFASVQLNVNKFVPVAYWSFNGTALPDNELVVLPYDTLTQSTYTFYSDPATGWNVSDTLYETPGITIDNSTYVITVEPTSFEHAGKGRAQVEYNEDATYQHGGCAIEFKILAQGADPEFFFDEDGVYMSQNSTTATRHLYDKSGLMEQGYTPTFTIGNSSYVSVAQRQDNPNEIEFTWLAEGETTVTTTITDGNETHSATVTAHCQWDRDWVDGHVYTSQNNEVNYEYGIVKNGSNPSLTFTASNGNTQDPINGDLFEVSIPSDTYNIISYTSTSSGLTISFDTSAAANASDGDEINMTIIKQQDTTYGYYTKDLRFKVVHAGNDPLLWWENGALFNVTENDVFSQDPITNWLGNQIIDFSTWQPLTPTLSITGNAAHLDQDNVLHGDSVGTSTITATVTDLNNNTHTATATVHVEAATFSNVSVHYNNDPNQGQGFLDTNPLYISSSDSLQVDILFEGPEYNTNNASNDFSVVYDTNFSTPKAMDATILYNGLTNNYSNGVNHIICTIYFDNVTMSTPGEQNRFIFTFGHSGTNYLTDYIKYELSEEVS